MKETSYMLQYKSMSLSELRDQLQYLESVVREREKNEQLTKWRQAMDAMEEYISIYGPVAFRYMCYGEPAELRFDASCMDSFLPGVIDTEGVAMCF